jgi:hypothetical protein
VGRHTRLQKKELGQALRIVTIIDVLDVEGKRGCHLG